MPRLVDPVFPARPPQRAVDHGGAAAAAASTHADLDAHPRKPYREARRPVSTKAYTINHESRYLVMEGVPTLGLHAEVRQLCEQVGELDECRPMDELQTPEGTEAYWIQYRAITAARAAKRKLDDYRFYGATIRLRYAPEYETLEDTRQKLLERRRTITRLVQRTSTDRR